MSTKHWIYEDRNTTQKFPYDLRLLAEAFTLTVSSSCATLHQWLDASFTLTDSELANLSYLL